MLSLPRTRIEYIYLWNEHKSIKFRVHQPAVQLWRSGVVAIDLIWATTDIISLWRIMCHINQCLATSSIYLSIDITTMQWQYILFFLTWTMEVSSLDWGMITFYYLARWLSTFVCGGGSIREKNDSEMKADTKKLRISQKKTIQNCIGLFQTQESNFSLSHHPPHAKEPVHRAILPDTVNTEKGRTTPVPDVK